MDIHSDNTEEIILDWKIMFTNTIKFFDARAFSRKGVIPNLNNDKTQNSRTT